MERRDASLVIVRGEHRMMGVRRVTKAVTTEVLGGTGGLGADIIIVTLTPLSLSAQDLLHRLSVDQGLLSLEHLYPVRQVGHVYQGGVAEAGCLVGPEIILHPLLGRVRARGAAHTVPNVVRAVVRVRAGHHVFLVTSVIGQTPGAHGAGAGLQAVQRGLGAPPGHGRHGLRDLEVERRAGEVTMR